MQLLLPPSDCSMQSQTFQRSLTHSACKLQLSVQPQRFVFSALPYPNLCCWGASREKWPSHPLNHLESTRTVITHFMPLVTPFLLLAVFVREGMARPSDTRALSSASATPHSIEHDAATVRCEWLKSHLKDVKVRSLSQYLLCLLKD